MDYLLRHNCWAGETLEPCKDVFVPSFFLLCCGTYCWLSANQVINEVMFEHESWAGDHWQMNLLKTQLQESMMIFLRAFQTSVQGSYEHNQFSSHIIVFLPSCSARGALSTFARSSLACSCFRLSAASQSGVKNEVVTPSFHASSSATMLPWIPSGVSVICWPLFLNMYHYCVSYYACSRYHMYDMYQIINPAASCAVKKTIELRSMCSGSVHH